MIFAWNSGGQTTPLFCPWVKDLEGRITVLPVFVLVPRLIVSRQLALVLNVPGLVWRGVNGWPQFDMAQSLPEQPVVGSPVNLLARQVLMIGPLLTPLWVVGLVTLIRRSQWRTYQVFTWASDRCGPRKASWSAKVPASRGRHLAATAPTRHLPTPQPIPRSQG
ncbi:hypothetical protein ACFFQW_18035 [Umezawaea endophytica]|uniref:Uncharacterized protein n=1 Tax=Umezawaea endophytica TaxID=1654476 RepID=A0A9X2VKX9_9PSEU|nr:hypothetical protein [Umezawaea endophytica]MCS7478563.1 hypothetical protein [Umezawaea endophytica]